LANGDYEGINMAESIIIFSGKQYSGKDTVAKILLEQMTDYKRCAMGDIIKLVYGSREGLSYEEIEQNKPIYRQGLIDLGNWGRSIDPDYWLKKIISQEGKIIVTDVRVPHELDVFKSAGATTIRVEASRETRASRGELVGETDITEIGLDDIKDWDFVIENNSDYKTLKTKALELVEKLKI
jgi:phosphomevalonate kinase